MEDQHLRKIADLLDNRTDAVVNAWKQKVANATRKPLDEAALTDSMADLIKEMAEILRSGIGNGVEEYKFRRGPISHGSQRVKVGFDIEEVISEYNILRDVLQDEAESVGLNLTGKVGHIINRVLNAAMTLSIRAYVQERDAETQRVRQERLSFMMHDLKTPLSAIASAAAIMESYGPVDDRQTNRDILGIISRNAKRMNDLLMRVVREENYLSNEPLVERRKLNLADLVGHLVTEVKPLADQVHIELRNEVPRDMMIDADPTLLAEVFQNLLSNAIKCTERGYIAITAERKNNTIECCVQDTGRGIEKGRIRRIFDKFETDSTGGQGLGLAIVKKIVEDHDGVVTVDSSLGKGSRFCFTIAQTLS